MSSAPESSGIANRDGCGHPDSLTGWCECEADSTPEKTKFGFTTDTNTTQGGLGWNLDAHRPSRRRRG